MSERWDIDVLVGPCSVSEVEEAAIAIADLAAVKNIGGVVSYGKTPLPKEETEAVCTLPVERED